MDARAHWEGMYAAKAPNAVSWYQAEPVLSLELIASAGLRPGASVVDVGAGASFLVDRLVELGYRVTALDLSRKALDTVRQRLGSRAGSVTFVEGDVATAALPASAFALWHDRAVLHFLTQPAEQRAYVRQLERCLEPGGRAVIATFGPDGPQRCSGLEVVRYSVETLGELLGPAFTLLAARREAHLTPAGATQRFQYSLWGLSGGADVRAGQGSP